MIVQRKAPWEAFHPIAEVEFMPFRDAGRGPSDFNLNIQDCLWGIWKAMQNGLCDMNEFSVDDYEYYEKVENGDWNWITPNFIAFASPVDANWIKRERETQSGNASPVRGGASPANHALQRKLPTPFMNCLDYFEKRNIKLVVRLNTELYDRSVFLDRGINHMELYFDDGTNPTDDIVRTFIDVSDAIIEAGGVVAVHVGFRFVLLKGTHLMTISVQCKAGLGRTGTLIGAYLIWKYGFTANEAIAFMRIVRPGSVVGPQQQYLYLKQLEWSKWAAVDEMRKQQAESANAAATLVTPATPPAEADEEMERLPTTPTSAVGAVSMPAPPVTPSRHVAAATAKARAIAPPGQPRKTPMGKRAAPPVDSDEEEENNDVLPALNAGLAARPVKRPPSRAKGGVTSSESRPTRVTRSTAGAANIKRTGGAQSKAAPPAPPAKGSAQPPNKIPRLAAGGTSRSVAASKAAAGPPRPQPPASPMPPSRLPTLIPSKRTHTAANSLSDVAHAAALKMGAEGSSRDSWMTTGASAVVVPGSKKEGPGLRNVRRRRSSFSAADVVA